MIDRVAAQAIAEAYVRAMAVESGMALAIVSVAEHDVGWVFIYNLAIAAESVSDMLLGNAPVLVDRRTGALTVLGTAEPVETYVERYRARV